jgi:hypothetical protein
VKDSLGVTAGEFPVDGDPITIDSPIPGLALCLENTKTRNPPLAQTLAGEQADFDFRLVEPTGVLGRVVNGEAFPQSGTTLRSEMVHQDLQGMRAQVVDD